MAINVIFKEGLAADYALLTKDARTFYRTTDTNELYIGDKKITNAADLQAALALIGTVPQGETVVSMINGVAGDLSDLEAALADVATTGNADDVTYDNTTSGLTATDVQAAIDEIASASAGGVGSKTVYITESVGTSSDAFSKRYGIYQGATGSTASPVAGEKLVDIDIPKDMVVSDGVCRQATAQDVSDAGANPGFVVGDYIVVLTIANNNGTKIYIPVNGLADIYTAEQSATQIQLVIDSNNEISATVVAGSITATELATDAVTTAKITDGNVTLAKLAAGVQISLGLANSAVQSVIEGATDGTVSVDGTDVSVHGLGSAAYENTTAFDASGSAAAAQSAAISSANSYTDTAVETALTWGSFN